MPRAKKAAAEKPSLPPLDALEAAQETARQWQEGSHKLSRAVDALRSGLETIVQAEFDHHTKLPVTAKDLRDLAVATLDAYSQVSGQNWRRAKLVGSFVGGTGNAPVHESQM